MANFLYAQFDDFQAMHLIRERCFGLTGDDIPVMACNMGRVSPLALSILYLYYTYICMLYAISQYTRIYECTKYICVYKIYENTFADLLPSHFDWMMIGIYPLQLFSSPSSVHEAGRSRIGFLRV